MKIMQEFLFEKQDEYFSNIAWKIIETKKMSSRINSYIDTIFASCR